MTGTERTGKSYHRCPSYNCAAIPLPKGTTTGAWMSLNHNIAHNASHRLVDRANFVSKIAKGVRRGLVGTAQPNPRPHYSDPEGTQPNTRMPPIGYKLQCGAWSISNSCNDQRSLLSSLMLPLPSSIPPAIFPGPSPPPHSPALKAPQVP